MVLDRLFGGERDEAVAGESPAEPDAGGDVADIRRAFSEMGSLSLDRRRFLAGYAYVLVRLARADGALNDDESARMESAVVAAGDVSETQGALMVALAVRMNSLYGATEDYAVTRDFARRSTPQERQRLMRAAVAVGRADGVITQAETVELNEIGTELGFHADEIAAIREQIDPHGGETSPERTTTDAGDEGG